MNHWISDIGMVLMIGTGLVFWVVVVVASFLAGFWLGAFILGISIIALGAGMVIYGETMDGL